MRKSYQIIITLIFLAGSMVFSGVSQASDYYIAQTTAGGDTGSDCSNAHSATWFNTAGNWGTGAGKINPGDTVHLCGTFTGAANSTMLTVQASGMSGYVTTVLFEPNAVLQAPYWSTSGALSCSGKSYIKVDGGSNGIIQNTNNGSTASGKIYHASSYGLFFNGCTNVEVADLTIKNIFINTGGDNPAASDTSGLNTSGIKINGNFSNSNIHDNIISNARANIWSEFDSATMSNVNIYNNIISDQGWGVNWGAGNTNSVANNINIYNNDISNWTLWQYPSSAYHTDGAIIYSNGGSGCAVTGQFYNNYVHGNLGAGSPTSFLQLGASVNNFKIYNNVFVCESSTAWGSCVSVWNGGTAVPNPTGTVVYNNTFKGLGSGAPPIVNQAGTTLTIKNNIFNNWTRGVYDYKADWSDIVSDYNIFYTTNGAVTNDSGASLTFAQWQASPYSQDLHSSTSNPNLSSTFYPQTGSSAIGTGVNLTSLGITPLDKDKASLARPTSTNWDKGAYTVPSSFSAPLSPPQNLKAQ